MKRIKTQASLLVVSVFAVAAVATAPVSAVVGQPNGGEVNAASEAKHGENRGKKVEELREKGKQKVAEERQAKQLPVSAEQRLKSCEKRAAALNAKLARFSTQAAKHQAVFDKIYDRVQDFQETKKLDAGNYDELVAAADLKQQAATEAVEALAAVTVEFDCENGDPAEAVATAKEAVATTRTALKEYRTAIKDVIRALNASASKDKSDEDAKEEDTASDSSTSGTDGATSTDGTNDGGTN